ncbi:MAG: prevent-host-death family protein [Methylococcaceae bacterium]|nr:prevent-host-death family protein [Methylococcaceae bacterium]
MKSFSINNLHEHPNALAQQADLGNLALLTDNGQPLFISVPFNSALLTHGLQLTLAVKLFKEHDISLGKAAELAKMNLAEFSEYVSELGIAVVDFNEDELDEELHYLAS